MTFPARRTSVRRWAGACVVVLLSSLALAACGNDDPVPTSGNAREPGKKSDRTPKPQEPSETPAETPAQEQDDDGTTVPIYWVGDGPGGEPRLFREFHRVQGDPLTEAARFVMGGGQPDDQDYRTLWPQVEVSDVGATDGILLVQLSGDGFTDRPDGMSKRDAQLAMQQLVYTLQGVQQERVPVVVQREGDLSVLGLPSDQPHEQASALETLNLVNITSPQEGATVTGDSLTVSGVANSFEASGPCRLLAGDEELATVGYQSDGWMEDRLFPFEVEIPLDGISGEVVLQCETDDPSGGAEGNGPAVDTKTITVQ